MEYEQENSIVVTDNSIKKRRDIEIPWKRLDKIFDFYKDNSDFKRRDAIVVFFPYSSSSFIHSISTREEIENRVTTRIVQFKNNLKDYKFIYQILSKIDLKSIHEIRFKTIKILRPPQKKIKANEVQILISSDISNGDNHEEIQPELKRIIEHLHTTIEQENSKEEMTSVPADRLNTISEIMTSHLNTKTNPENSKEAMDKCINFFSDSYLDTLSYTCLIEIYEKVLLWGRNNQRELLNNKTRDDFFEKLVMGHKELLIWLLGSKPQNIDDFIPTKKDRLKQMRVKKILKDECNIEDSLKVYKLKAFISHAMFIANKIKCSKYVPNRENKRKKAKQMWKQYAFRKSQRRSKKSQREIAEEVGVSLGTLNSWFKEFNQFKI